MNVYSSSAVKQRSTKSKNFTFGQNRKQDQKWRTVRLSAKAECLLKVRWYFRPKRNRNRKWIVPGPEAVHCGTETGQYTIVAVTWNAFDMKIENVSQCKKITFKSLMVTVNKVMHYYCSLQWGTGIRLWYACWRVTAFGLVNLRLCNFLSVTTESTAHTVPKPNVGWLTFSRNRMSTESAHFSTSSPKTEIRSTSDVKLNLVKFHSSTSKQTPHSAPTYHTHP